MREKSISPPWETAQPLSWQALHPVPTLQGINKHTTARCQGKTELAARRVGRTSLRLGGAQYRSCVALSRCRQSWQRGQLGGGGTRLRLWRPPTQEPCGS